MIFHCDALFKGLPLWSGNPVSVLAQAKSISPGKKAHLALLTPIYLCQVSVEMHHGSSNLGSNLLYARPGRLLQGLLKKGSDDYPGDESATYSAFEHNC